MSAPLHQEILHVDSIPNITIAHQAFAALQFHRKTACLDGYSFFNVSNRSFVRTTSTENNCWAWCRGQLTYKFILSLGRPKWVNNNDHWIRNNLDIKDKIMSIVRSMEGWMKSRHANSIYMYNSDAGMILHVFVIFACSFLQYCWQCLTPQFRNINSEWVGESGGQQT